MKRILLLLILFANNPFNAFSQSGNPYFTSGPTLGNGYVCYNGTATISGQTIDADSYQLEIETPEGWQNFSGATGSASSGGFLFNINNFTYSNNFRIKLTNNSSGNSSYSNTFFIAADRPDINIQPQDQLQCYNQNVSFSVNDLGADYTYQWQKGETNSGPYSNLANSSKYKNVATATLTLNAIKTSDNDYFKCVVTHQSTGCQNTSNIAGLAINYISTISPTTTNPFCEGDEATFKASNITGEPLTYAWQYKIGSSGSFIDAVEGDVFENVATEKLTVKAIPADFYAAQLTIDFKTILQSGNSTAVGQCTYESDRSGYKVNARPSAPALVKNDTVCHSGALTLLIEDDRTTGMNWYTDTLSTSLHEGNSYLTPVLTETQTYYANYIDSKGCGSFFKSAEAVVLPRPALTISASEDVCPKAGSFEIPYANPQNDPIKYSLNSSSLTGFTDVTDANLTTSPLVISLPDSVAAGNYSFLLSVEGNTGCYSENYQISLKVKKPTIIITQPEGVEVCENEGIQLSVTASGEGTLNYQWYFNGNPIPNEVSSSLTIVNAVLANTGAYQCYVTASCGGVMSASAEVKVKELTKITTQSTDASVCEGGDLSFSVTATGSGILHYQWLFNGAMVGKDSAGVNLTGLSLNQNGHELICKVTGDCGTVDTDPIQITVNAKAALPNVANKTYCLNTTATPLTADVLSNHSLLWYGTAPSGGTASFTAPTPQTSVLGSTLYYVSQVSPEGCESERAALEVQIIANPEVSLSVSNTLICSSGALNNSADIAANLTGTYASVSYSWLLNDVKLSVAANTNQITATAAGVYQVVIDVGGCLDTSGVFIQEVEPLLTTPPVVSSSGNVGPFAVCIGNSITLNAVSDESATFQWFGSADSELLLATTSDVVLNDVQQDTTLYVSAVTTNLGLQCASPRAEAVVIVNPLPDVAMTIKNESCPNAADGSIGLQVNNGFSPITYVLNGNESNSTGLFTSLSNGSYNIAVTNANGCILSLDTVINATDLITFKRQPSDQTNCKGNLVSFISVINTTDAIQWEKMLPGGSWQEIVGATDTLLKFSGIGNATYPDGTKFRLKAGVGPCIVYSSEATLHVNAILENLDSQTGCAGEALTFEAPEVNGSVLSYEWQGRALSSGPWGVVQNPSSTSSYTIPALSNADHNWYFRVKYTFDKLDGSTCTITSDDGRVTVVEVTDTELSGPTEICSGEEVTLTATGCNGTVKWSSGQEGAEISVAPTEDVVLTATCVNGICQKDALNELAIHVLPGIVKPTLIADIDAICFGDSSQLTVTGCDGVIMWNDETTGAIRFVKPINQQTYWVTCMANGCLSPKSDTVTVTGYPTLSAGEISYTGLLQCAGYNPPSLVSTSAASGGRGAIVYTWEVIENCTSIEALDGWLSIPDATGSTYNPSTLQASACYRRIAHDECGEVYSNAVMVEIAADPVITVNASQNSICNGNAIELMANVAGGAGSCDLTWQINTRSSASGSSFWETIANTGASISITDLVNTSIDTQRVYFRAIYDCSLTSCNKATAAAIEIIQLPSNDVYFDIPDTVICNGSSLSFSALGCGGELTWADDYSGGSLREVIVTENQSYTVTCSGVCDMTTATVQVAVIPGYEMPVSTTPLSVIVPDILTFSAEGTSLLWYASSTADTALSAAPQITEPGEYTYYVTQSNSTCESPRLPITAQVYVPLNITQQPYDAYDCEGNSVYFEVKAEGVGKLFYQWQRKKPGELDFSFITNEDEGIKFASEPYLRVSAVGDKDNPTYSQYRCLVTDSLGAMVSEAKTLYANVLLNTLPNLEACKGDDFEIDLHAYMVVIGDVESYNWQVRDDVLDKWVDIREDFHVRGAHTRILKFVDIRPEHGRKYRCQVNFNTGGYLCTENSDQTLLKIGTYPDKPTDMSIDYCLGETTKTLSYNPKPDFDTWYFRATDEVGTTKAPKPSSDSAGVFNYWFTATTSEGCESPKAKYTVNIHDLPEAPMSLTPARVFEGDTLVFNALGADLKWYTSSRGTKFDYNRPTYTEPDEYTHYVSQTTADGCEGPRTFIKSEIIGTAGFKKDLESLADCDGNSVRFYANAKGLAPLTYQWQKKLPSDSVFITLENELSDQLLVENIGSTDFPDGTEFRVIVKDSTGSKKTSNAGLLTVNSISGNLTDQYFCEGAMLNIDERKLEVAGLVDHYELQIQDGRSWLLVDTSSSLQFNTHPSFDSTGNSYRIRAVFNGERSSTCTRNTNSFTIQKAQRPEKPLDLDLTVCQNTALASVIDKNDGDLDFGLWVNESFVEIDSIFLDTTGQRTFKYVSQNAQGCKSEPAVLTLEVKEANVDLQLVENQFSMCYFDTTAFDDFDMPASTSWFLDSLLQLPIGKNEFYSSLEKGVNYFWLSSENENGCWSKAAEISVIAEDCISETFVADACVEVGRTAVSGDDWVYFYDKKGGLIAGVYPEGRDLGNVSVGYSNHLAPSLKTPNLTAYLPRYFYVNSSEPFDGALKIKLFVSASEIEDYLGDVEADEYNDGQFQSVTYRGFNEDCQLLNNDNFENGESWVQTTLPHLKALSDDIYYFELSIDANAEIGFTTNDFAAMRAVNASVNDQQGISIDFDNSNTVRLKSFELSTSADAVDWYTLKSFVADEPTQFTDLLATEGMHYYRLVSVDADGTHKLIAETEFNYLPEQMKCYSYPNPVDAQADIFLFTQNIEPVEIEMTDIFGKYFNVFLSNGPTNQQKISFGSELASGVYTLRVRNLDGKTCSWKMIR